MDLLPNKLLKAETKGKNKLQKRRKVRKRNRVESLALDARAGQS